MWHEFFEYLVSVIDHAFFWFGGIVLVIIESLKKVSRTKAWAERLRWEFWALAGLCIFIATFQTWHEEKVKGKEGAVYLRIAAIAPRIKPTNPDAFPIGEPLNINVAWTVFGQKPAFNARQDGKVYLEDDAVTTTQERIVKDFQIMWEDELERMKIVKERSTIFPGDKAEWLYLTYAGKTISEEEKLGIKYGRKTVFIIGAVRFQDVLGEHEAHLCRWLETRPDGIFGTEAWHECNLWITQIDINND
jgi:hypothetical protein